MLLLVIPVAVVVVAVLIALQVRACGRDREAIRTGFAALHAELDAELMQKVTR